MAIYHLAATVIARARGQSVVAAAAYRSGTALRDERYGITHNYVGRGGVVHAQIMAPAGAPVWTYDRQQLWNRVEAAELRKDSQLARVVEVGLPLELTLDECVVLMRDFVAGEFVAKGMVADFCIRRDDVGNPRSQILLTLRSLQPSGFGPKERRWNGKANLLEWRAAWAERVNEHLARAGHAVRIDHRTLEAQQIELTPGRYVGIGGALGDTAVGTGGRSGASRLPDHLAARLARRQSIARDNGQAIVEDPALLLRALTHQRPTFTAHDLASFLKPRTDGAAQFEAAYLAVTQCKDLVALGSGDQSRFTSRDMIEAAKSLKHRAVSMANRRGHGIPGNSPPPSAQLNEEQRRVLAYLVSEGDAKALVVADADKYAVLGAARVAWEAAGLQVRGAARSGAAAENLQAVAGIESRCLSSWEEEWVPGRDALAREAVLLVDGAEMLGLKQLERLLAVADKGRAKVALIGDSVRLRAMKIAPPFGEVLREIGLSAQA